MSKFNKVAALIITAVSLMSLIFYGLVGFSQSPKSTVKLTTNPPISEILPFEAEAVKPQSPVSLSLQALTPSGERLENSKIHLQIFTPSKNLFLPTDFPLVEGTKLLDLEASSPTGELQIQQMLPIRGKYQIVVNVSPLIANQFTPFKQTLTLNVPENPVKYRNFALVVVVLLTVGIVGGLVIGGRQVIHTGEIAPQRVRLLLSGLVITAIATLLFVNISAEMAESHTHNHQPAIPQKTNSVNNEINVEINGDHSATVGQVARMQVQATDPKTGESRTDVVFKLKTTAVENNWVAFAYKGATDESGQLTWQQQFFDGAPHRVEVEVSPQPNTSKPFQAFQIAKEIEVEGVAPPLGMRLIVLSYFTAIIVIGLGIGLWLKRRLGIKYQL